MCILESPEFHTAGLKNLVLSRYARGDIGIKIVDKREDGGYITPVDSEGKYETFISRIRQDNSKKNSLNLWIVSDNLLRGAALNAVEIAEAYYKLKK